MTQEADCVLLLQSPGALLEPRFIATAYAAVLYKVPICCGFFTTTSNESHEHKFAYSFTQANDVLQTLSSALDHDDLQDLQTLIGPSLLVDEVGSQLQKVLPKIISKPIGLPSPNGAGALTATRLVTSSHHSLLSRQQLQLQLLMRCTRFDAASLPGRLNVGCVRAVLQRCVIWNRRCVARSPIATSEN